MFFDGWESVARVVVLAGLTYLLLIGALRIVGEQALAKMSAYDVLVTIALGSVLVSIPFSEHVTMVDGIAAVATLLVLQESTRFLAKRSWRVRRLVTQQPHLVLWDGRPLPDRMAAINITLQEVQAAVRAAGLGSFRLVAAVVLEIDGEWSVIPTSEAGDLSALLELDLPPGMAAP
jgi:uncharacterized membrane protein YcaP (DUF421 family)